MNYTMSLTSIRANHSSLTWFQYRFVTTEKHLFTRCMVTWSYAAVLFSLLSITFSICDAGCNETILLFQLRFLCKAYHLAVLRKDHISGEIISTSTFFGLKLYFIRWQVLRGQISRDFFWTITKSSHGQYQNKAVPLKDWKWQASLGWIVYTMCYTIYYPTWAG